MTNRWEVMSEYHQEQHPLLCEEASEEELYSPKFYRRVHPMTYRGRATVNHKGAAAILRRWPDHWSSFLTYWWIAIGMISLTTFVIYNSLFAFSMLPSTNTKPVNSEVTKVDSSTSVKISTLPEVYIHVFADPHEDMKINQHMPYIDEIAGNFQDYTFNFIVIVNDTDVAWMSAEDNNELALNLLWTKDKYVYQRETHSSNIIIEYISLSTFMDCSPLKKIWRTLPHQLIEFLARTVSIWDKGGIAFNPDILTPSFQHTIYIEKLQKLLNKYAHTNKVIKDFKVQNKRTKTPKKIKKINNIRDIIDALEKEDKSANIDTQQTLFEAENKNIPIIRYKRQVPVSIDIKSVHPHHETDNIRSKTNTNGVLNHTVNNTNIDTLKTNNSSKLNLLPLLFMEFLFLNKNHRSNEPILATRTRKSIITPSPKKDNSSFHKSNLEEKENGTEYLLKPVIVSAPVNYNKSNIYNFTNTFRTNETEQITQMNELTIDLKGNIIATDTACHAFLGTIYSNVVHHNQEETITDFIIAELTIFCKGLLSSCMGIDLILL